VPIGFEGHRFEDSVVEYDVAFFYIDRCDSVSEIELKYLYVTVIPLNDSTLGPLARPLLASPQYFAFGLYREQND
jgi:hypothetical protein